MHETQFSQVNLPTISLLIYQNIHLVYEPDIPFVHYSKDMYLKQHDNQILDGDDIDDTSSTMLSHAEFRRQIHILSEQNRRKKINYAFEELRKKLPNTYTGHKMSKVVILQK
ncbi:42203_t:CDS:2, partial [Gigaspora margarita]